MKQEFTLVGGKLYTWKEYFQQTSEGLRLKCMCCNFEQTFKDGEEAFSQGWDAPPHFTGYICCNLCPASHLVLGEKNTAHEQQHERWARDGRPEDFEIP